MVNIKGMIEFSIQDIFKSDILEIRFKNYNQIYGIKSEYPNLIYQSIQQNFVIENQVINDISYNITIKREGE